MLHLLLPHCKMCGQKPGIPSTVWMHEHRNKCTVPSVLLKQLLGHWIPSYARPGLINYWAWSFHHLVRSMSSQHFLGRSYIWYLLSNKLCWEWFIMKTCRVKGKRAQGEKEPLHFLVERSTGWASGTQACQERSSRCWLGKLLVSRWDALTWQRFDRRCIEQQAMPIKSVPVSFSRCSHLLRLDTI